MSSNCAVERVPSPDCFTTSHDAWIAVRLTWGNMNPHPSGDCTTFLHKLHHYTQYNVEIGIGARACRSCS
jgi:hypothetical protein